MLNASHYHATETLPNGLRLLIRATEPDQPQVIFLSVPSTEALTVRQGSRVVRELRFCQSGRPGRACPT